MVFGTRKRSERPVGIAFEQLKPALETLPSIHHGILRLSGNMRYVRQFVA
jgi:hypothetical protein